ncbi:MAG: hypothetical protein AAGD38_16250 [Acidobacteriota bacterium]
MNRDLEDRLARLERQSRIQRLLLIALPCVFVVAQLVAQPPKPPPFTIDPGVSGQLGDLIRPDTVRFAGRTVEASAFVVVNPLTRETVIRMARDADTGLGMVELFDPNGDRRALFEVVGSGEGTGRFGFDVELFDQQGESHVALRSTVSDFPILSMRARRGERQQQITPNGINVREGRRNRVVIDKDKILLNRGDGNQLRLEDDKLTMRSAGGNLELGVEGQPRFELEDADDQRRFTAHLDNGRPVLELSNPEAP